MAAPHHWDQHLAWSLACEVSYSLSTFKQGCSGIVLESVHRSLQEGRGTLTLAPSLLWRFIHQAFRKAEAGSRQSASGPRLGAVSALLGNAKHAARPPHDSGWARRRWPGTGVPQALSSYVLGNQAKGRLQIPLVTSLLSAGTHAASGIRVCSGS